MLAQHARRMSYAEIYKYRQQTPAMPARITELLNVARANLVFIPRLTADNKTCDPLLDKYLQLKKELAAAIEAEENGAPCEMLEAAEYSFRSGESETLVEGWVRMWVKNESERMAQEMLDAAHKHQEQFISPIPDHDRINARADADIAVIETFNKMADAAKMSVGVEYYNGKRKPYRAYREQDGHKAYVGYFAEESEAWQALGAH